MLGLPKGCLDRSLEVADVAWGAESCGGGRSVAAHLVVGV